MGPSGDLPQRPMPPQGDPDSQICRQCDEPKVIVKGVLMCETCDAGQVNGITIRPTWRKP